MKPDSAGAVVRSGCRLDARARPARLDGEHRPGALPVKAARTILGFLALFAAATVAGAAGECAPDQWLADPGISPDVLEASGYRVVTRQTLTLADGRQAMDTVVADGQRKARCRVIYDASGPVVETVCYLPCRDR